MVWKEATSDSSAPDHETMRAAQHKSCRSSIHISEKYLASKETIVSRTHQQSDSSCGPLIGGGDEAGPGSTYNGVQELSTSLQAAGGGGGGGRPLSSPEELRSPHYNLSLEAATESPSRVTSIAKKTRRRGDELFSMDPKSCVEMSPKLTKMLKTMEAPPPLKLDMDPPLRKARVSVRARSDAATVSHGLLL
jgi:hypothetical protein